MIKKIILITSLSFISFPALSYRHGCALKNTLYFSFIKDHTKAIEVCKVAGHYKVTYGVVGNPEIVLSKPDLKINKIFYPSGTGLRIEDGSNYYEVMGQKFSDAVMKLNVNGKMIYQVLDTRDENFINSVDDTISL